jgi:nitroreductase
MDTIIAIQTRQSYGVFRSEPIPRNIIEALLSAGCQAPNHYKVRPWRFIVLTGSGLHRLGDVMAKSLAQKSENLSAEALAKERAKPLRAPLIIAVGVDKPTEPRISEIENICAAAAACQNILLASREYGLSTIWRTGPSALDPIVKEFLGLANNQHLIAFLYIGFPENLPTPIERPTFTDRTVWME